jgi:hypothetical protein
MQFFSLILKPLLDIISRGVLFLFLYQAGKKDAILDQAEETIETGMKSNELRNRIQKLDNSDIDDMLTFDPKRVPDNKTSK